MGGQQSRPDGLWCEPGGVPCNRMDYTANPAPGNQDLGLAAGSGGFDSWDPGEFGVVPDEMKKDSMQNPSPAGSLVKARQIPSGIT